jgi:hypothetical protein
LSSMLSESEQPKAKKKIIDSALKFISQLHTTFIAK